MFYKSAFFSCVLAAASLAAVGVRANEVQITISGTGDPTTVLDVAQKPIPSGYFVTRAGGYFTVNPLSERINGVASTDIFRFGNGIFFPVLDLNGNYAEVLGPDLFSGTVSSPTFVVGSYREFNLNGFHIDTVKISAIAAVPEPSTWAMMVIGFAGLGFAANRRARSSGSMASATL